MALTLELAQTVAIGAFNPYVITPESLVRFGICTQGEGEEVDIRLQGQRKLWEVLVICNTCASVAYLVDRSVCGSLAISRRVNNGRSAACRVG